MFVLPDNTIDNLLFFLPKDINKLIYKFYDTRCSVCSIELKLCLNCNLYFHPYHKCFNHKIETCSICYSSSCPLISITNKYCVCILNYTCENCYYMDDVLKEIEDYPDNNQEIRDINMEHFFLINHPLGE